MGNDKKPQELEGALIVDDDGPEPASTSARTSDVDPQETARPSWRTRCSRKS